MIDPTQAINSDTDQSDINLMLAYSIDLSPSEGKKQDPKTAIIATAVLASSAAKTAHHLLHAAGKGSTAPGNSDPNFDAGMETFLKNLNNSPQLGQAGSPPSGPGPAQDPNFPPCPFDPNNVPSSPQDVVAEMRDWLSYIESYKQDPNAIFGFLQWTANVQAQMGSFSQDGQTLIQTTFTNLTNVDFGPGYSLAQMFVDVLQNSYFFDPNSGQSNEQSCTNGLNYLLSMFSGSGQNNWFINQIRSSIGANQANIGNYFLQNEDASGNPVYTVDQFWSWQEGQLAGCLTQSDPLKAFLRQQLMNEIDYLIAHCKSGILPQMIMSTLGDNMNMQQQGLGGYGALSNTMNSFAQIESQLNNMFSGNFTSANAQQFFDQLTKLLSETSWKSSILGPVVPSMVQSLYNDIAGLSDPTIPAPGGPTIASLLQQNPPPWDQIATIMNNNKSTGTTTNMMFQQIVGDFKNVDTGLSSQTQVISTAEGTITSKINTLQSSIKDMMITQYSEGWMNAIVQNQSKANS